MHILHVNYNWGGLRKGDIMPASSIPHETQPLQVLSFHERLNGVIILWATMIDALLQVDAQECYTLAFALLDLQPDAMYVDHVMLRTESEAPHA